MAYNILNNWASSALFLLKFSLGQVHLATMASKFPSGWAKHTSAAGPFPRLVLLGPRQMSPWIHPYGSPCLLPILLLLLESFCFPYLKLTSHIPPFLVLLSSHYLVYSVFVHLIILPWFPKRLHAGVCVIHHLSLIYGGVAATPLGSS